MKHLLLLLLFTTFSVAQTKKEDLALMPWPQKIVVTEGKFVLDSKFKVKITGNPDDRLYASATRFLRRLDGKTGLFFEQGFVTKEEVSSSMQLEINCARPGKIAIKEDESYSLNISTGGVKIEAATDLGAMHALETLLQLLQNEEGKFYFPLVNINDNPRFVWRGLMIDVARHFQPLEVIKRNLDAMAVVKMNVFHWHLVDDQGWRIEIKKHPKLVELGSDGLFYKQDEIKEIVKYAEDRGIMVIPEIDVPGHATALLTAYPELGSKLNPDGSTYKNYTIERNAGIFNPTLDPTKPDTYKLISEIFEEVCPLFPSSYFHIGGDENNGLDWDLNPKIQEFKKSNGLKTNHDLQTYFNMQLVPILNKHGKTIMGWEEIMTSGMAKQAIIHSWKGINEGVAPGVSLATAAKNGYQTVLSNGYYIDLMLGVDSHYLTDPISKNSNLNLEEKSRILGGEATMWGELVTPLIIDSRIWPRTAAIAERLWSDESITDLVSLRKRLKRISFLLEDVGITHIRNKEVILRNIANNQNTTALNDFSNICEPLKNYSRNSGGIEYKSYSPFSLFADACTADASDALDFELAVNNYLNNRNQTNKQKVDSFFIKWIKMHNNLVLLGKNAPLVMPIIPLSKALNDASQRFLLINKKNKQNTKITDIILSQLTEKCNSKAYADVELAVYSSLQKLLKN